MEEAVAERGGVRTPRVKGEREKGGLYIRGLLKYPKYERYDEYRQ